MNDTRLVVAAAGLFLLVPTNASALFDGVPFSSPRELAVVIGLVFLLSLRSTRTPILAKIRNFSEIKRRSLVVVLVALALLKVIVYLTYPTQGEFEVCYRQFNARSGVSCLHTFEPHPRLATVSAQFASRSTEVSTINFGPRDSEAFRLSDSTWRLPFVNSLDLDRGFWPWQSKEKSIETFPFWAEYRGEVKLLPDESLKITYLGQGRILLDRTRYDLSPAYDVPSVLLVSDWSGSGRLVVDFAYLNTRSNGDATSPPYALLRVERLTEGRTELIRPETLLVPLVLNVLTDSLVWMALIFLIWIARRSVHHLLLGTTLAAACWFLTSNRFDIGIGPLWFESEVVLLAIALLTLGGSRHRYGYLLPSVFLVGLGLTIREVEASRGFTPQIGDILVRLRGNDHLVYHGFAREMLSSGFLRGAEDIFYFQPGIRYVFYSLQLFFGDSGILTGAVSVALIGSGILFFITGMSVQDSPLSRLVQVVTTISLVTWWSSSHTLQSSIDGLSEFGTWICLLFVFGLLLRIQWWWSIPLIGVLSAFVVWIRPNQGVAMMMVLVVALFLRLRVDRRLPRVVIGVSLPFLALLLLIPVHNAVFGKQFAFLPGGHLNAGQARWSTILGFFSDDASREFILGQARGLLYLPTVLPSIYSPRLAMALVGFLIVALLAGVRSFSVQRKEPVLATLLFLTVVGQVVPFLKYTLFRYYPNHNIAVYLTFVLGAALYVSSLESKVASNATVSLAADGEGFNAR